MIFQDFGKIDMQWKQPKDHSFSMYTKVFEKLAFEITVGQWSFTVVPAFLTAKKLHWKVQHDSLTNTGV